MSIRSDIGKGFVGGLLRGYAFVVGVPVLIYLGWHYWHVAFPVAAPVNQVEQEAAPVQDLDDIHNLLKERSCQSINVEPC